MKTQILARPEHLEQCAVIEWANLMQHEFPKLRLLHAIPNGGHRQYGTAVKLQKEGVKPGVPDLCLPVPIGGFNGLYVEMKRRDASPSDVSRVQRQWIAALIEEGYAVGVAKGSDAAQEIILSYLTGRFDADDFSGVVQAPAA